MVSMEQYPQGLYYSKDHEWLRVEGDKGTVGITWFAQDELGDVVFVELPEVGQELKANEPFGVVESVKTVSDVYAPVDGRVVSINEELNDKPELINEDPYGKGWMLVMEIADKSQLDNLMDAAGYKEMVEGDN